MDLKQPKLSDFIQIHLLLAFIADQQAKLQLVQTKIPILWNYNEKPLKKGNPNRNVIHKEYWKIRMSISCYSKTQKPPETKGL